MESPTNRSDLVAAAKEIVAAIQRLHELGGIDDVFGKMPDDRDDDVVNASLSTTESVPGKPTRQIRQERVEALKLARDLARSFADTADRHIDPERENALDDLNADIHKLKQQLDIVSAQSSHSRKHLDR